VAFKVKWFCMMLGLPSNWLNFVFKKIREQTGGRLRFTLSGGAPISEEAQRFLSVTVCPVLQGYGMTESCGMAAVLSPEMYRLGSVGSNVPCVEFKLVDAVENGYTSRDKPNPRGEIWVRGPSIMSGYYKNEAETKKSLNDEGWLMTGDIGVLNEDGTLSIVDRRKNLVKLSNGEYIALEKVESVYKASKYAMNLCVVADSLHASPIALVMVAEKDIERLAKTQSKEDMSLHNLTQDVEIKKAVLEELQQVAKQGGLKGAEIVQGVILTDEEWTAENGLLTAAQKIKRAQLVQKYKQEIDEAYSTIA